MIKVPKNQILWMTIREEGGNPKQIITSDQMRGKYFLYDINEDGSLIKIETAVTPVFKKDILKKK
jgi:hypothetical protein